MAYALLKMCYITTQSAANKKDSPNYINEIAKQLSINDLRTTKNLLTSKPTRKTLKPSAEYWALKKN